MAIQHVTRAARVFRQLGKHMHMVGVGGTGKATVAKLAAFIENCVFLRPFVSRTYNLVEFRDDLKKASFRAGVKGHNTVLFLTDNLVKVSCGDDLSVLLGSLSTHVSETRTATGSELFSLLTCPHTTTFTLLSIFSPLEMSSIKSWEITQSKHAKCYLPVAVRVSKTRVLKLPSTKKISTYQ